MPCGRPVPLQRRAVRSIARTGMTTTAAIRGVLIASAIPWVCLMTPGAEAQTLRAIETDPPAGAVLAEREQLYVRLAYTSRGPVRFDVEGWLDGRAVRAAATSIQPEYPAGDGETLVWLAYRDPTRVDELRVRMYDAESLVVAEAIVPVQAEWRRGTADSRRVRAEWVGRLNERQQQLGRAARARAAAEAGDTGDSAVNALLGIMMLSVVGYPLLQFQVYRTWRGRWRIAGLLPLVGAAPVLIITALSLAAGSNLWPLLLLFTFPVGLLYLTGLAAAHALAGRRRSPHGHPRG